MVTGAGSVVCLSMVVLLLADVAGATAGVEAATGSFFIITPLVALDTDDCTERRIIFMDSRRWKKKSTTKPHVVTTKCAMTTGSDGPVDQDRPTAGPGFCPGSPSVSVSPHEAASAPAAAASASPHTASP